MNHDATHCADYVKGKCPVNCYRAQLTEELNERRKEFIGVPISYAAYLGSTECELSNIPKTEGMKLLSQMEDVLLAWDKPGAESRTPTMKSFLIVGRAVYFLLSKYVRETHK